MKKILSLAILGILVLSGFGAADLLEHDSDIDKIIEIVSLSSKPTLSEEEGYLSLEFVGANSLLDEVGKPMLPIYRKTFEFSKDVKIKEVTCKYLDINEESINGKILPTPESLPLNYPKLNKILKS